MSGQSQAAHWSRWFNGLTVAIIATGMAMLLQQFIRAAWQVRTVPERVMEWLLLFVPLDLFERGLQRFGADAKAFALVATLAGMAALLVAIGVLTVRALGSGWSILAVGPGLCLFTMLAVMPVHGCRASLRPSCWSIRS